MQKLPRTYRLYPETVDDIQTIAKALRLSSATAVIEYLVRREMERLEDRERERLETLERDRERERHGQ